MFVKNVAVTGFPFSLLSSTTGAATAGLTVAGRILKDGGTSAAVTNSVVDEGNGQYSIDLTQAEMNATLIGLLFTAAGAVSRDFTIKTVVANLDVANLAANVAQWSGTNVAAVDTAGYPKVTLKGGTGTGELSLSSGLVTLAATTHTGAVIPTVTTTTTATNVTTVNGLAAGVITATSIAADAITDAKVASDVTIASVTGAVGSVTGNVGGNVVGSVASVTAGVGLSGLETSILQSGTAQAGASTTITLASGASATDSLYVGCVVRVYGGTGAGQARTITGYVGSTKVATVDRAWATNPSSSSTYAVVAADNPILSSSLAVTAGTVSDKTGYALTQAFPSNFSSLAITAGGIASADVQTIKTQAVTCAAGVTVLASVGTAATSTAQTGDSYAIVNSGTFGNAMLVRSTVPANALDVSSTGEVGLDFNNIKDATGAHTLTNITVPTVTTTGTATAVTTVNGLAAGVITATSIASNALTSAKIATDAIGAAQVAADAVTEIQSGLATAAAMTTLSGYVDTEVAAILAAVDTEVGAIKAKTDNLPASPAATGDIPTVGEIADGVWDAAQTDHLTAGTFGAYLDASVSGVSTGGVSASDIATEVWAATTRTLTAGTNIVLAKGTGITGFIDLSAAAVNAEVDTALSDVGLTSTVTGRIDAAVTTRMATFTYTAPPTAADNLAAWKADADVITLLAVGDALDLMIVDDGAGAYEYTAGALANAPTGGAAPTAADIWTYATRVLTAGTNIALAKGTGLTGLNDLSAAQVNAESDAALADVGLTTTVTGRVDAAVSTRAAATTALSNATWTDAKAVFLDAAISGVSTGGVSVGDIADAVRTELTTELARIDVAISSVAGGGGGSTAADIWAYGSRTLTGGTVDANVVEVDGSPVAVGTLSPAEIVAEMDANSTKLTAIVADTAELQAEWADGGRLDLLLDDAAEGGAGGGTATLDLTQTLGAPRALDSVGDAAVTVGDALWAATVEMAGDFARSGGTLVKKTATGTTVRTFVFDSAIAPTSRN